MAQMDKEEMTALAPYTIKDLIALDPNFDLLYLEEDDTVGTALTKLQQKGERACACVSCHVRHVLVSPRRH